jgi:c(7)-type cytochrome triheme protein
MLSTMQFNKFFIPYQYHFAFPTFIRHHLFSRHYPAPSVSFRQPLEFSGGEEGKVVFSGDVHGPKAGLKCSDCHPKPFAFKKGSFKMSKDDHGKPDYCGKCHDGNEHFNKVVFSQSKEENCGKCHKKEEPKKEEPIKKEGDK